MSLFLEHADSDIAPVKSTGDTRFYINADGDMLPVDYLPSIPGPVNREARDANVRKAILSENRRSAATLCTLVTIVSISVSFLAALLRWHGIQVGAIIVAGVFSVPAYFLPLVGGHYEQ